MQFLPRRALVQGVVRATAARKGARGWGWYHETLKKMEDGEGDITKTLEWRLLHEPTCERPRCFMDIRVKEDQLARLTFELAAEITPRTCDNFVRLCTGEGGFTYKGTKLATVHESSYVLGGDFGVGDGRGGHSSFGTQYFEDENFVLKHISRGTLAMANSGVDRNSSLFYVTADKLPHLDGRSVVFGRLVDSEAALKTVLGVFTSKGKPLDDLMVENCGLL